MIFKSSKALHATRGNDRINYQAILTCAKFYNYNKELSLSSFPQYTIKQEKIQNCSETKIRNTSTVK